jgi:hypothetical protein
MLTTLERFGDEYRAHAERGECLAGACTVASLSPILEPLPGVDAASASEPG